MSNSKMSVEQILAACRGQDGAGSAAETDGESSATGRTEVSTDAVADSAPAKAVDSAAASAKQPGEMSVADILAAARGKDGGSAATPAKVADAPASGTGPAAKAKKDPSQMSVADMLAAARGQGPSAPAKPAPAKPAAPAAKSAAAKTKPAPPAAEKRLPRETSSILAAARQGAETWPHVEGRSGPANESRRTDEDAGRGADPSGETRLCSAEAHGEAEWRAASRVLVGLFWIVPRGWFFQFGRREWAVGTGVGPLHVPEHPHRTAEPLQSRFSGGFPAGVRRDAVQSRSSASGSPTRSLKDSGRSSR